MNRLKIQLEEFFSIYRSEIKYILKDPGVLLIMVGAIIIYSTIYSLAYRNEVLREVPIAVVDQSNTPSSRGMIRALSAAPNIEITATASDLIEAKSLFMNREVYGVIVIPKDYERKLLRMEQVAVAIYADASYFLMYRQLFSDAVSAIGSSSNQIEWQRFVSGGVGDATAKVVADPVVIRSKTLFNPYSGYGTFIMPAILILIIQQTLLIGIGMIGGTWYEQKLYKSFTPEGERYLSIIPLLFGKTLAYLSLYAITLTYIFGVHYHLFGFPMNGSFGDILQLLIPYMLSAIFLSIAISTLFRNRENSILFLLFTSIPLLMLSGASLPVEAMPSWLVMIAKAIPSSSAIDGFLRIQTMGASLSEVATHYHTLWILTIVYFALAYFTLRRVVHQSE
ncbi:MAG: ABC transporter permease [Bacteroidales bacterium]